MWTWAHSRRCTKRCASRAASPGEVDCVAAVPEAAGQLHAHACREKCRPGRMRWDAGRKGGAARRRRRSSGKSRTIGTATREGHRTRPPTAPCRQRTSTSPACRVTRAAAAAAAAAAAVPVATASCYLLSVLPLLPHPHTHRCAESLACRPPAGLGPYFASRRLAAWLGYGARYNATLPPYDASGGPNKWFSKSVVNLDVCGSGGGGSRAVANINLGYHGPATALGGRGHLGAEISLRCGAACWTDWGVRG